MCARRVGQLFIFFIPPPTALTATHHGYYPESASIIYSPRSFHLSPMSRKRSASIISVDSDTKRPKHATPEDEPSSAQQLETTQNIAGRDSSSEWADEESFSAVPSLSPTLHHIARCGIQRSIAMVLAHDGFQSASPEALESFTGAVEMCRHPLCFHRPFFFFFFAFSLT